jgi:type III pantothenate kinase
MILLIDVGNTNITTGFFEEGIRNIFRLKTGQKARVMNEVKKLISRSRIKKPNGAVMCSVVPRAASFLSRSIKQNFGYEPLQNPGELGADRIANAVAAHELYKGHLIVVDFGTATTFCFITSRGQYRGGVIMPGVGISADTLAKKTAKLPRIQLRAPENVIGKTTEDNILPGLVLGHAGAVERIIREMKREISPRSKKTPLQVIATGGLAHLIVPYVRSIKTLHNHLTLEGLRIIYELNV